MAEYTRFKKRMFANVDKIPETGMERIAFRLGNVKQEPGASLQLKGMIQRSNYQKPKTQAKFRAHIKYIMEESNPKNLPVVPKQSPANRGQYVQKNWKKFL